MTKILWFSRHAMTVAQKQDLIAKFGKIEITQANGSPANVHVAFDCAAPEVGETAADFVLDGAQAPLKDLVKCFDEFAAVLPIGLQQQVLPFCPSGRILAAKNARIVLPEGKVEFSHVKWEQITEIKIVVSDL